MAAAREGVWRAGTLLGLAVACFAVVFAPADVRADDDQFRATIRDMQSSSETIVLTIGKSKLIDFSMPIEVASVAAPEIADFTQLSPKQLMITGKSYGATHLIVWAQTAGGEKISMAFDVLVQLDATEIRTALRQVDTRAEVDIAVHANNIVVNGTARDADTITKVLEVAALYAPTVLNHMRVAGEQQVLLRVTVAEVSKEAIRRLGVNGFLAGDDFTDVFMFSNIGGINPTAIGPNLTGPSPINAMNTIPFFVPQGGIPISSDTTFSLGFPRVQMQLFFEALRENDLLRVLAEPNLVALSGRPANFLVGGEVPVPVPQGLQQVTIEFKRFGVLLDFVPTVTSDQTIRLYVRPEISDIDPTTGTTVQGNFVFGFINRYVETTVEVGNGQTLAIGGLLREDYRGVTEKIPGIGDLPILGQLFASNDFQESRTELMILVTPEIVGPVNPDQVIPVPGEDMTPPNDYELFAEGKLEGEPAPHPIDPERALRTEIPAKRQPGAEGSDMSIHGPWGMADEHEGRGQ